MNNWVLERLKPTCPSQSDSWHQVTCTQGCLPHWEVPQGGGCWPKVSGRQITRNRVWKASGLKIGYIFPVPRKEKVGQPCVEKQRRLQSYYKIKTS